MKKLLVGFLLASLAALNGCSGDSNGFSSVTNPNPNTFNPKGTVSGLLRDAVTNVPLVNAKVSISDKSATTNEAGLFTIYNVPALNGAGNEPTNVNPNYPVVIDMSAINRDRASKSLPLYPSNAYINVNVTYSSLGETNQAVGNTNATNHDTPVDGFVANLDCFIGKLDAGIKMQVVGANLVPVVGASVYLYQSGATPGALPNSSTGANQAAPGSAPGHLVAGPLTSDANGFVTFTNIEAKQAFFIKATTAAGLEGWYNNYAAIPPGGVTPGVNAQPGPAAIISPADGQTDTYAVQGGGPSFQAGTLYSSALVVTSSDGVAPYILSVSPANLADIAIPTSGDLNVVYTFSEPIRSTNYANAVTRDLATNNGNRGLYNNVIVSYLGPKAGNINHTIAWNDTRTQLTVTIPAISLTAASRYQVNITSAIDGTAVAGDRLQDANRNNFVAFAGGNTFFTTQGNFNVAAPLIVKTNLTNSLAIEWATVSNAASYKVYVAITGIQPYAALGTAANGTTVYAVAGFPTFNMATVVPPLNLTNGREYTVKVTTVNGGGSESPYSNQISFTEAAPGAVTGIAKTALATDVTSYTYTWTTVPSAVSYNVYVEPVVGGLGSGYDPAPVNTSVPTIDLTAKIAAVTAAMVAPIGPFTSQFNKGQQAIVWNVRISAVAPLGAEGVPTIATTQIVDQTRAQGVAIQNTVGAAPSVAVRPVAAPVVGTIAGAAVTGTGSLIAAFGNPFPALPKTMNYTDLNTVANWSISAPAGSTGTTFTVTSVTPAANGESAVINYSYSIATVAVAPANTMAVGNATVSFLGKSVSTLGVGNNPF